MLRAELVEFARAIRDKRPYPVGIDDVLHGMAVFDACVQSAKTGRIVEIAAR
jgi:predicted dehydrogenase